MGDVLLLVRQGGKGSGPVAIWAGRSLDFHRVGHTVLEEEEVDLAVVPIAIVVELGGLATMPPTLEQFAQDVGFQDGTGHRPGRQRLGRRRTYALHRGVYGLTRIRRGSWSDFSTILIEDVVTGSRYQGHVLRAKLVGQNGLSFVCFEVSASRVKAAAKPRHDAGGVTIFSGQGLMRARVQAIG